MKKNQLSPLVARMVEEFERRNEQSAAAPANPRVTQNVQKSSHPKSPEKGEHTTATPPTTSYVRNTEQSNIAPQDSQTLHLRATPQRSSRAKDHERIKTQNPEVLYDIPVSQKLSHLGEKLNKAKLEEEPHYATPAPQKPPRAIDKKQDNSSDQESEILYATPASQKPSHIKESSPNIMQRNLLLEAYQEEIRFWSGVVYDNRLILEEETKEIKRNPAMGEQFSWKIATYPHSVSKLAGKKILGIKNKKRRQAEESVSSLCSAISSYAYTVKYSQESSLFVSHAEQKTEKATLPLSNREIANRVQRDPSVRYAQEEICYWANIVYGDPFIFQQRAEEIQKSPRMGEELSWQIRSYPTFFSPLAGKKVLGIKNKTRKRAEAYLPSLCIAIDDYTETVKQVRESIAQAHQTQQRHQEAATGLDKSLLRQESILQSSQLTEGQSKSRLQETAETSRQTEKKLQDVRPRTVAATSKRTEQHLQEKVLQTSHAKQKRHEQKTEKVMIPLSNREIANRVQRDPSVQYAQEEICYWSNIVYGDPLIFQQRAEEIQKSPGMGEELSWQIRNYPTFFSPLAGKKMLGIRSEARKRAEANLPSLCTAIDNYTELVKQVRESITQTHQKQQQQRHQEAATGLDESLLTQESVLQSSRLTEHLSESRLQGIAETSRQAEKRLQDVRPRTATPAKAMAFAS
ncbi:BID domain-containing T4SS effector [Bartonella alsatica]|uniref:Bartonella effector protein BID domain-containing protein n=2 Tax=Bartonella alsatica TaxID=52764 RepID=J0PUH0_9HYPH|nr:BID domain-containing T4SS effector [Bartonella alsatica]EJF76216.1 hypothetical protein MEC_00019 [Bartonella alsatica IBS 382]QLC51825.1 BID domain-containing T4SS effector [Bartonella alsatica]